MEEGNLFLPESFTGHFLISDAMVDQCLVPHRVQGVFKCLRAKLVRLRKRSMKKDINKMCNVLKL